MKSHFQDVFLQGYDKPSTKGKYSPIDIFRSLHTSSPSLKLDNHKIKLSTLGFPIIE